MSRNVVLRLGLLAASALIAATAIFILQLRDDENPDRRILETTSRVETSRSLYGAAAQFPQGTNPPIGVERTDAVSSDARIFLEEATRTGDTVTAFGRFTGGVPECALLNASKDVSSEGDIEVAEDTFLFTAPVGSPGGNLTVRCTIAGRFFASGPPEEEITVE